MKFYRCLACLILLWLSLVSHAQDVNTDGQVSPRDVMFIVNRIGQALTEQNQVADVNGDEQISLADARQVRKALPMPTLIRYDLAEDYVVYYGVGQESALSRYAIAIIDPETLDDTQLQSLIASGTVVFAYLSVGEVETYRAWYSDGRVDPSWIIAENPIWHSYYMDANQAGWRALTRDIMGEYLERGFHGVFLDTVDTVDIYEDYNLPMDGMISLIEEMREAYPDALIIQNRGFTVMEDTAPFINGIMFESLSTNYDFENCIYLLQEPELELVTELQSLDETYGIRILALDYALATSPDTVNAAQTIAHSFGFLSFVSEILLQTIPPETPTSTPCD